MLLFPGASLARCGCLMKSRGQSASRRPKSVFFLPNTEKRGFLSNFATCAILSHLLSPRLLTLTWTNKEIKSDMPRPSVAELLGPDGNFKSYSCLNCRQRKVKCDRRTPCSNCVKAEKQCSFIPPVRGKRKRTKPLREGLHAKLKRYEELLKSYGAKVDPSKNFDDSDSETLSRSDAELDEDAESRSKSRYDAFELEEAKPKFITKEGTSRYFDRYACY